MQTDWLIDFMMLAQTRSFSRAAQLRQVTQPALSRRIRSLEAWAMTALVDRSSQPARLTPAGELLYAETPALVASVQRTQTMLRTKAQADQDVLAFGCTHTLAISFFPGWLCRHSASLGAAKARLTELDPGEVVQMLNDGQCDLLLAYAPGPRAEPARTLLFDSMLVARDRLVPVSRPGPCGQPLHVFPGTPRRPSQYLGYSSRAEFGPLIEQAVPGTGACPHLHRVFEADATESLKAMAMAGQGMAFLPEHSIQAELGRKTLVPAGDPLPVDLEIHLMRKRSAHSVSGLRLRDRFWSSLTAQDTTSGLARSL
jgi:DNA-binding transcriptional LysR family regulator